MKVLVVHNRYRQSAGEDAAVDAQVALLRSAGHDVVLWQQDSRDIDGWTVLRKVGLPARALLSVSAYRDLRALCRREQPDVAHVHNVFPLISPAAYVALSDGGVPVIQTLHNYRLMCPNGLFFRRGRVCELCSSGRMHHAVRYACYHGSRAHSAAYALSIGAHRAAGTFSRVSAYIALTAFAAHKVVQAGIAPKDKVHVLGNYAPAPLPSPREAPPAVPTFAFLGRLSEEKGVACLVAASSKIGVARVVIAGTGPMLEPMKAHAAARGLPVEFPGWVAGAQKQALLSGATALVVPSLGYEGFPLTVLDAYAAGVPVIAPRHGGFPDLVQDGETGLLFSPGDPEDLAACMRRLASEPELSAAMGRGARELVLERYTEAAFLRGLLAIYEAARDYGRSPVDAPSDGVGDVSAREDLT